MIQLRLFAAEVIVTETMVSFAGTVSAGTPMIIMFDRSQEQIQAVSFALPLAARSFVLTGVRVH